MESKSLNGTVVRDYLKKWFYSTVVVQPNRTEPLLDELQAARREWGYAEQYFNLVSEPDLVDLAIYNIGVTEKKYLYLLKKARESGVSAEQYSYH